MTVATHDTRAPAPGRPASHPGRGVRRWLLGRRSAPWEWAALGGLLALAGAAYCYRLTAGGWTNTFYSAAVQAGSQSWAAFLFGSSDASLGIAVDKPPAFLWVTGLFVRAFGLSPFTVLFPQVLMGLATAWLVWVCVRRSFGPAAALLAAAVLLTTPVATLMFRFNNPDTLLVLTLTVALWATLHAIDDARLRWPILIGAAFGLAFLTKQLQALLPLPGLVVTYWFAARARGATRWRTLGVAAATCLLAAGWWVALVQLVPAASRPFVGGSTDNSFIQMTLGINAVSRIGPVGFQPGNFQWWRLLASPATASQIGWLLPAATALGIVLLVRWRTRPRADAPRAQVLAWFTWLAVTAAVFSLMLGLFHPYYTVALAPAIAALVGIGAEQLWPSRGGRQWLAGIAAATSVYAAVVMYATAPHFLPWLRIVVPAAGCIGATIVAWSARYVPADPATQAHPQGRRREPAQAEPRRGKAAGLGAALCLAAVLTGPVTYSAATLPLNHEGTIPVAGPPSDVQHATNTGPYRPGAPTAMEQTVTSGGAGYRWAAATLGSRPAASLQLATGLPVLAIGGFALHDPFPTLDQFRAMVADGQVRYFVTAGDAPPDSDAAAILAWVQDTYAPLWAGDRVYYDLG